eukprot:11200991-Lingulodinium_polyedra.AAC.1
MQIRMNTFTEHSHGADCKSMGGTLKHVMEDKGWNKVQAMSVLREMHALLCMGVSTGGKTRLVSEID